MIRSATPASPASQAQLNAFFADLSGHGQPVLMLDYDGTLAPFQVRRDEAVPYTGVREILGQIMQAGHTRLVVVSGRWTQDLLPLLDLDPTPEIWGSHGWERLMPDGSLRIGDMDAQALAGLKRATEALANQPWTDRLETKPGCLAIHWRGLVDSDRKKLEDTAQRTWPAIARESGLDLKAFDGGLELRVPGRHKGDAVRTILAETPTEAPVAYLGDDLTDEDAFEALEGRGTGILVRGESRPTRAKLWLRPPAQLIEFLERWQNILREK